MHNVGISYQRKMTIIQHFYIFLILSASLFDKESIYPNISMDSLFFLKTLYIEGSFSPFLFTGHRLCLLNSVFARPLCMRICCQFKV